MLIEQPSEIIKTRIRQIFAQRLRTAIALENVWPRKFKHISGVLVECVCRFTVFVEAALQGNNFNVT
jgi:hypothetical protein